MTEIPCPSCGAVWEVNSGDYHGQTIVEEFRVHAWNCPHIPDPDDDSPTEYRLAESGAV